MFFKIYNIFSIISLNFLYISCRNIENIEKLEHVQVLFRHGDRVPTLIVPNDNIPNFVWPFRPGTLTNQGRTRAFRLGEYLKNRYSSFLYENPDVNAQSSMVHRCLESTQLVLAGLFPPKPSEVWSSDVPLAALWRPFSVETKPIKEDDIFYPKDCDATSMILLRTMAQPETQKLLNDNKQFLERITKAAKVGKNLFHFTRIFDNIMCERSFFGSNYTKPSWLSDDDISRIDDLYFKVQKLLYRGSNPDDSLRYFRIKAGPFFNYLLSNFDKKQKKIEVYGSHDSKIMDIMNAMDFTMGFPLFSTTITFELWSNSTGESYLKIFYIEPEKDFKITQLSFDKSTRFANFCETKTCSLTQFRKALQNILIHDDCSYSPASNGNQTNKLNNSLD